MSKEIWIIIVAILVLLSPFIAAEIKGSEQQLLGWADRVLPKSAATETAQDGYSSDTDLRLRSAGVQALRKKLTKGKVMGNTHFLLAKKNHRNRYVSCIVSCL